MPAPRGAVAWTTAVEPARAAVSRRRCLGMLHPPGPPAPAPARRSVSLAPWTLVHAGVYLPGVGYCPEEMHAPQGGSRPLPHAQCRGTQEQQH